MSRYFGGGSTDNIAVSSAAIDSQTTFTISAWAYMISVGGSGVGNLLNKRDSGAASGIDFILYGANHGIPSGPEFIFIAWRWPTYGQWTMTPDAALNTWTHVVVSYDYGSTSNVPVMYQNGVARSVSALQSPAGTRAGAGSGSLIVGNNLSSGGTQNFDGDMKDVTTYNRILAAGEVRQLYYQGPPRIPGLVLWLPMGIASPEPNWAPQGSVANGSVTGTSANVTRSKQPAYGSAMFGFDEEAAAGDTSTPTITPRAFVAGCIG